MELQAQQAEAVSPRLRATLVRVAAGSLARFRASLIAKQQKWLQQLAKEAGAHLPQARVNKWRDQLLLCTLHIMLTDYMRDQKKV